MFISILIFTTFGTTARADPPPAAPASSSPRYVLSTEPFAWRDGRYSLALAIAVSEHVALRGELSFAQTQPFNDGPVSADVTRRLTGTVQVFVDHTFQGFYVEGGVVAESLGIAPAREIEPVGPAFEPVGYLGWQWTDRSTHLSIAAAVGVSLAPVAVIVPYLIPESYLSVGYAW